LRIVQSPELDLPVDPGQLRIKHKTRRLKMAKALIFSAFSSYCAGASQPRNNPGGADLTFATTQPRAREANVKSKAPPEPNTC
jgi:hypothetical protein